jgi:hypothetical protein
VIVVGEIEVLSWPDSLIMAGLPGVFVIYAAYFESFDAIAMGVIMTYMVLVCFIQRKAQRLNYLIEAKSGNALDESTTEGDN